MRYILLLIMMVSLSSCMDISTTTTYNRSLTSASSTSNDIPLSFSDSKGAVYYFILVASTDGTSSHNLLKVRWVNPDKNYRQFNGLNSSLKFILDRERILTLMPIKEPALVGYDFNNNTREEEAIYHITRDQIEDIANSKTVEVELTGKHRIGFAKFNKWHSFRGFKAFLKSS